MISKRFIRVFFSLFMLIAILHTAIHFVAYEVGVFGLSSEAVSGLAIGNIEVGEGIQEGYPINFPASRIIVLAEWILIIVGTVFVSVKERIRLNKETYELMLRVRKRKLKLGTDIDKLYEILKERKKISFKAISRAFKVSDETVRKWGTTLESGNLARVEYPSIGYPELVIKGK